MVNVGSLLALGLIGLALVFNKEIALFLGALKFAGGATGGGGGEVAFEDSLAGKAVETTFGTQAVTNLTSNLTQTPLPEDPLFGTEGIFTNPEESSLAPIFVAGQETAKIFTDPEVSVLAPVFQAGEETRKIVDQIAESIFKAGEETAKVTIPAIQDFEKTISDTLGGLTSFFGGQQEPKMILTQAEATDPTRDKGTQDIIVAQQPDPSLVSPFIKAPEIRTRGEIRFGR